MCSLAPESSNQSWDESDKAQENIVDIPDGGVGVWGTDEDEKVVAEVIWLEVGGEEVVPEASNCDCWRRDTRWL